MKKVYLTIGPRGSGKTTFCKKIIKENPTIYFISRDEIFMEMFGTVYLDLGSPDRQIATNKMWEEVGQVLSGEEDLVLILDTWNESVESRINIISRLRLLGADQVVGLIFVVSEDQGVEWFFKKQSILKNPVFEERYRNKFTRFYEQEISLDQGFDEIQKINLLVKMRKKSC